MSTITRFGYDGKIYRHVIFTREDDRIELQDEKGNVILTFTADCYVLDKDKKKIGTFHLVHKSYEWYFKPYGTDEKIVFTRDLLESEAELSRLYLKGELQELVNPRK